MTGNEVILYLICVACGGLLSNCQACADWEPMAKLPLYTRIDQGVAGRWVLHVQMVMPNAGWHPIWGRSFILGLAIAADNTEKWMFREYLPHCRKIAWFWQAVVVNKNQNITHGLLNSPQSGWGEAKFWLWDDTEMRRPIGRNLLSQGWGRGIVN